MALKHKAFLSALKLIDLDPRRSRQFLNDRRLSMHEKMILMAQFEIRNFHNVEALEILSKFTSSDNFIESQRLFFLGAAQNNLTKHEEAARSYEAAIDLMGDSAPELRLHYLQSLFTIHLNCGRVDRMARTLKDLEVHGAPVELITYCRFALAVQKRDFVLARSMVASVEKAYPGLTEHKAISYLYDLMDLQIQELNYEGALKSVSRLRVFKKYKNSSQINYMQRMIEFLSKGTPIYLYERDFEDYPFLKTHLSCLLALEKGDTACAIDHWNALRLERPNDFGEPFEYIGFPNAFSHCLNKLLRPKENVVVELKRTGSLEARLFGILSRTTIPVSKEAIHLELWDRPAESKDDLKKLVKLAQNLRKKHSVEIKTIKGAYFLVREQKVS